MPEVGEARNPVSKDPLRDKLLGYVPMGAPSEAAAATGFDHR
eukprot:COSAG01_NODE_38622_length_487_cov_0.935567_1_plen_41_part_10